MNDQMVAIRQQIMWNRLIAVVEEQAQVMIRTAFSTTVREAGDLSAGVFDLHGRMLAQAVTGTPGHVNSMAESVSHFLAKFPAATMRPGDHYITNDPWLGTGHLHDLTVVTPAFLGEHIVGLIANTAHVMDVGGRGMGPDARSVFEEGLYIPIVKCFDQGQPNETFFDFLRAASRLPIELEGDVYSLCACNDAGARRLSQMLAEFDQISLDPLAGFIFDASLKATLAEIAKLPGGVFEAETISDGYEAPVVLRAAMTISADRIDVDFNGTSPPSRYGINVPAPYARAYSCFGIKVVVAPAVPNNWASLKPFHMHIPHDCILNTPPPYPVAVRHVIGQMLPDLMMSCLYQSVPQRVSAEGSSCLWNPPLRGGPQVSGPPTGNRPGLPNFEVTTFNNGGMGARPWRDGLDSVAFPSGVRTMPVEATENVAPVIFWRKELTPDSGGAGRTRGGCAPIMEIGTKGDLEFAVSAIFDRVDNPPHGRDGGQGGMAGGVHLSDGTVLRTKGYQVIPDGQHLLLQLPGGGGLGDAATRDPALVAADVRNGLVSVAAARTAYRVVADVNGDVDDAATRALRGGQAMIRNATDADLPAILAITNQAILHTTALWTIHVATLETRGAWMQERLAAGFPVIVAERDGIAAGFGSFGAFRPHDAYVHTVEHSLYVAPEHQGHGLGRALLLALIERAQAIGKHAMVGGIEAQNTASLALHRACGFSNNGTLPQVGRKFDRWMDLTFMVRLL